MGLKVILYMAITANGIIARENNETPFTSSEDYASFKKTCLRTKAVIAGRKTYELIRKDTGFFWPECHYYVVTSNKNLLKLTHETNVTLVNLKPTEVIKLIEQDGYSEVCIMGGGQTNASFLTTGAVDEIILDIEPFIYLRGIPLFRPIQDLDIKLNLISITKLSSQTVQLHYKVLK